MTDRELLELAAKAVGLDYVCWMSGAMAYRRNGNLAKWNPLTDDGDALRLAVDLHMKVYPGEAYPWCKHSADYQPGACVDEDECADKHAATRRAIVLAAAEIGRKGNE